MLALFLVTYAASVLYASGSTSEGESFGRSKEGGRPRRKGQKGRRHGKKKGGGQEEDQSGPDSGEEGDDADPLERAREKIDLEFDLDEIGDDVTSRMFFDDDYDDELDLGDEEESFGVFPGPPTGAQVLRSAGLAQPGSWTERNVLQAGARDAWSRRIAGNASEADFAVLRAARPGIASSSSGYISPAWTRGRWPGDGGTSSEGSSLEDTVADDMGFKGR